LAFVAALQHLTGHQRAVLIIREVLGFSAVETADLLDTSVPAVNSVLQRARATAGARLPERSQQDALRQLGDVHVQDLAARYADAIQRSDIEGLCSMLADDATWSMPPAPNWYRGIPAIARFHTDFVASERWRHRTTPANGQLAVGCYTFNSAERCYVGGVLDVLTLTGDRIAAVTAFIGADFSSFGLPHSLPVESI
jgi:RNA polymerase sigma-70 factor (ECF subfamily)